MNVLNATVIENRFPQPRPGQVRLECGRARDHRNSHSRVPQNQNGSSATIIAAERADSVSNHCTSNGCN